MVSSNDPEIQRGQARLHCDHRPAEPQPPLRFNHGYAMISENPTNPALGPQSRGRVCRNTTKLLRVMKFGGTSVADASCIRRVADIVQAAWSESNIVIVVSAMSGVTDKFIQAASHSEAGDRNSVEMILEELREQHKAALAELVESEVVRKPILNQMYDLFDDAYRLCQRRELAVDARDLIASLGERLSAPLVAVAL